MKTSTVKFCGILLLLSCNVLLAEDDGKKGHAFKPCVTMTGTDSQFSERSYHRIQSIDEWAKVWQKHTGQIDVKFKNFNKQYDSHYNVLGLPLIDFENYMVIAVFQGDGANSAGLKAEAILELEDRITFRFDDKSYQTMGGAESVRVYGLFVIPRSPKKLVLEENVQHRIGKPAEWKERITFESLQIK